MNIGFVINNIGNSELALDMLQSINGIKDNKISPCVFYQNLVPPVVNPNCLFMNLSGLSNYSGKLVAMDLESASIIYKNNQKSENWLYIWELEWLSNTVNYNQCMNILDNFKIVTISDTYKKIISNYSGRDDIIVVKNVGELLKCLI
jgi:hypothetical protein